MTDTQPPPSCQYIDLKGHALRDQGYGRVARALEPVENIVSLATLGLGGALAFISNLNVLLAFSALAASVGRIVLTTNIYGAYKTMPNTEAQEESFTRPEINELAINKRPTESELTSQIKYKQKIRHAKNHFVYGSASTAILFSVASYAINHSSSHPVAAALISTAVFGGPTIAHNISAWARFRKCEQGKWAVVYRPKPHEVREEQPAHAEAIPAFLQA
jgi:hypothetical protein